MKKIICILLILILSAGAFLAYEHFSKTSAPDSNVWSPDDEFNESCYVEIKKTPGEDFVILNLTDIQLSDGQLNTDVETNTFALITKAIEDQSPDLITLSGDNAIGSKAYLRTVEFIFDEC